MQIRAARFETDVPGIKQVVNAFETYPVTNDQVRGWFEHNPPGRISLRLVAVDETNAVAGYCVVVHEPLAPEHYFYVWVGVDPALRGHGTGSALWNAALDFLHRQGATRLSSEVRDDDPASLAFAERRGFTIDQHVFNSSLDLDTFDETPYLPDIAALEAQGIRFCVLADFPDTPETRRKLYDLNSANALDIPGTVHLPWTFEEFEEMMKEAWFVREGQLLAVEGDTWVGLAAVSLIPETQRAYNLHTGVKSTYRGRKIAQALKVLAARYAREHGARKLDTDNNTRNAPIVAINRKMGYQAQAGKYQLVCWLSKPGENHP